MPFDLDGLIPPGFTLRIHRASDGEFFHVESDLSAKSRVVATLVETLYCSCCGTRHEVRWHKGYGETPEQATQKACDSLHDWVRTCERATRLTARDEPASPASATTPQPSPSSEGADS